MHRLPGQPSRLGEAASRLLLDVLTAAGLLLDDRPSKIERYFTSQFAGLPDEMIQQLRAWLEVMVEGSRAAPRRRPREPQTVRNQIRHIAPPLRVWASQGHQSLAEITRDEILAVLPGAGAKRHLTDQGLRSLFSVLKSRKAVFANPMRGIPRTRTAPNVPLPLDTSVIKAALASSNPAIALAVALVAFHAITSRQVRDLKLTDIRDGRLTVDGRTFPLAAPVLPRLSAWLDHRARIWPGTINAHLFVTRRSGKRLTPVGRSFPWTTVEFHAQALREDRILDEVRATGGDLVQICALFGMSVEGALRYVTTLGNQDLVDGSAVGSRTHDPR